MKALIFTEPGNAQVTDIEDPQIGPEDVLVRSHAVGICHSDFDLYDGQYIIPITYPVVPGHEWSGEIVDVGDAVKGFDVGDRVVGECVVGPGGKDHFGFSIDGADAEYVRVRAEWLHKLPENLSYTDGALVEPFSVAYNAVVSAGRVDPSDIVCVFGGGPIGLLCLMAAVASNATVILLEPEAGRRDNATKFGAHATLDPRADAFTDAVADVTDGRGFDVVIEAAGAPTAMATALEVAGHSARVVYAGINVGAQAPAELGLIQSKALRIRGMIGSAGVWPETIRFLSSGVVDVAQIVTARHPLADALDALDSARDTTNNIKVHIQTSQ